jgi:hypothetical protein
MNILVEPGYRVQLPVEWARGLGLEGTAQLEKTADGILIRPCRPLTWDEVFANKLTNGKPSQKEADNVNSDDVSL